MLLLHMLLHFPQWPACRLGEGLTGFLPRISPRRCMPGKHLVQMVRGMLAPKAVARRHHQCRKCTQHFGKPRQCRQRRI